MCCLCCLRSQKNSQLHDKLLEQDLARKEIDWNKNCQTKTHKSGITGKGTYSKLSMIIELKRCAQLLALKNAKIELHHCCDALQLVCGTVLYLGNAKQAQRGALCIYAKQVKCSTTENTKYAKA